MNPNNPKDLKKLRQAMTWSRRKLKPFREKRLEAIRQYAGFNYSDDAAKDHVPINLLELAVNIYSLQLAAQNPSVLVTTRHKRLKPMASTLGLAVQHLIESEIDFEKTIRRVVKDSLFCMGIMKVGLTRTGGQVEVEGFLHDVGQPYADAVHLDDWVMDMSSRRYEEVQFAGNRYRLPLEYVKQSGLIDSDDAATLGPTSKRLYDEEGDERAESISVGSDTDPDEYQDHIELWDIWLPQENLLVTVPVEREDILLNVVEWDGPEGGPFHFLGYEDVPGNSMPLSPVATWMDLHDLANRLYRKLGRQAERQKKFAGVRGAASDDAGRLVNVNDGEVIRLDAPEAAKELSLGGIDERNLAFLIHVKDLYAYLAGNLDSLGGLSPQSETLGQDKLLSASASRRITQMQDTVASFTKNVIRDLAWYLWTDPLIEIPLTKRVASTDIEIPVTFSPEQREGDFLDYNFDIEPYSMQQKSPSSRLQTLVQVFQNFIVPFAGPMQQQGIVVNFESLLRTIAKYADMNELEDILTFANPELEGQGPVGQPARQSPVTHRINERVNRPGATRAGKDDALVRLLSGSRLQDSEAAALGRPTG